MSYQKTRLLRSETAFIMFRRWFTGIMRIWSRPLRNLLPLLLILSLSNNAPASEGVLESRVGSTYMFVFPGAVAEPKGIVQVGDTITILYWLRISGKKSRFIAMDGAWTVPAHFPIAQTGNKWAGGFMIRDTGQHQLDIKLAPRIWDKVKDVPNRDQLVALEKQMSRTANLRLTISGIKPHYKIVQVTID